MTSSSSLLSLVALLLFVASTPLPGHARPRPHGPHGPHFHDNPLPNLINVFGQLCCTANGTCPGQALAGVPATLTCLTNEVPTVIAQTVTDANGTFTVSNIPTSTLPACAVTIARSAVNGATCSVLSTTGSALNGVLLSVVQFGAPIVDGVLNGTVSGFVAV